MELGRWRLGEGARDCEDGGGHRKPPKQVVPMARLRADAENRIGRQPIEDEHTLVDKRDDDEKCRKRADQESDKTRKECEQGRRELLDVRGGIVGGGQHACLKDVRQLVEFTHSPACAQRVVA
eukprot:scaffold175922_cov27-Tisochrysis_lutea.AAC.2